MNPIIANAYLMSGKVFADVEIPDMSGNENVVKLVNAILTIAGYLKAIAMPIAIVALVFCAVKMLFASDPQAVKVAKNWMLTIVIALAIIWLAVPIVTTVANAFN